MTAKLFPCPRHWTDGHWLENRHRLLEAFQSSSAGISFQGCEWLDLLPLTDLLLICGRHLWEGGDLVVGLDTKSTETRRVARFLLDTQFLAEVERIAGTAGGLLTWLLDDQEVEASGICRALGNVVLPPKLLDFDTLVPCQVVNASEWEKPELVHDFCKMLREECLARDRAFAQGMSVPLIYQTKLLLNAVLPELVDNVRLHGAPKDDGNAYFSLFARIRRRVDGDRFARLPADVQRPRSRFEGKSAHLWQRDVVEVAICDGGPGIHGSWLARWRKGHSPRRVPRYGAGKSPRLDSADADAHLIRAVFETNASSLPETVRVLQGLPRVTGLHAIRRVVEAGEFFLGIRSGLSSLPICSRSDDHARDSAPKIELTGRERHVESSGVQVLVRAAGASGKRLSEWADGCPKGGLEGATAWWELGYPERFRGCHVTNESALPAGTERGDVIIVRAHHVLNKAGLLGLVREVSERGLRLVFFDLPTPIALQTQVILELLRRDLSELQVPIVTNDLRVHVACSKYPIRDGASFIAGGPSDGKAWWTRDDSPIASLRDVFSRCRQVDSEAFWKEIDQIEGAFLGEVVKWNTGVILTGGLLAVEVALGQRHVRKMLRRRLVALAESLRLEGLEPVDESLRYWVREVERNVVFNERSTPSRVGLLCTTKVGGSRLAAVGRKLGIGDSLVHVPIMVYPREKIVGTVSSERGPDEQPRVFDWAPSRAVVAVGNSAEENPKPRYERRGRSGYVAVPATPEPEKGNGRWGRGTSNVLLRQELIEFGHFSFGRHHYFVWLNLLKFLLDRSGDCQEMLQAIRAKAEGLAPDWVFYPPHEVTHAFLEQLRDEAGVSCDGSPWSAPRCWPLNEIALFEATYGATCRGARAILIDDAIVSGTTLRRAARRLRAMGISEIHAFVLVDRSDSLAPRAEVLGDVRSVAAWWTVGVPPIGDGADCSLCRGISRLERLGAEAAGSPLGGELELMVGPWAKVDHLERYSSPLEPGEVEESRQVATGTQVQARLARSTSWTTVRAIEACVQGESLAAFLDSEESHPTELFAGLVLHDVAGSGEAERRRLIARLIQACWRESRSAARGLALIALASLDRVTLRHALEIVTGQIRSLGVETVEKTAFSVALARMTLSEPSEIEAILKDWSDWRDKSSDKTAALGVRTEGLLRLFSSSTIPWSPQWRALQALGIPGRGKGHELFQPLIDEFCSDSHRSWVDWERRRRLFLFLDSVEAGFQAVLQSCEACETRSQLQSMFGEWSEVRRKAPDHVPATELLKKTRRYLWESVEGRPNLRQVLAKELVHYIPLCIHEVIQELAESEASVEERDFECGFRLTGECQRILMKRWTDPAEEFALRDEVRRQADHLVVAEREGVLQVLRDVLSDVKHSKSATRGLRGQGRPYMRIDLGLNSTGCYEVTTTNRGESLTREYSWRATEQVMTELDGSAAQELASGFVTRTLAFRKQIRSRTGERPE